MRKFIIIIGQHEWRDGISLNRGTNYLLRFLDLNRFLSYITLNVRQIKNLQFCFCLQLFSWKIYSFIWGLAIIFAKLSCLVELLCKLIIHIKWLPSSSNWWGEVLSQVTMYSSYVESVSKFLAFHFPAPKAILTSAVIKHSRLFVLFESSLHRVVHSS